MIVAALSSTFRTLTVYNACTHTVLSITSFRIQRAIHLHRFPCQYRQKGLSARIRKSIDKSIGVTHRPQTPLPPFLRFMKQERASVQAQYPHLKQTDLNRMISERWQSLQDAEKEIALKAYRDDLLKYAEDLENFNQTLTDDQKRLIDEKVEQIRDRKLINSYKKQALELNKPKKPACSFLRFFHAQTDRRPNESYKDHMKRTASRWQTLSKTKKKKYATTPEEFENYKREMLAWEATVTQLIEAGGDNVTLTSKQKSIQDDDGCVEEDESDDEGL